MINSNTELIYVLGTKAQFIKSKYILKNLIENNCKIYILDTGQHKEITSKELDFLKNFELITLSKNKKNISTISSMIFWFLKILITNNKIDEISRAQYCLVHGDTISTLIGLIFAKRNNLKIVHIESGLRSYNWLKPFPEEIIRFLVTKYSDVISIDSKVAENNVQKYKGQKHIIKLSRNTIYDSVISYKNSFDIQKKDTLTVTIHRTENIYNKKKLKEFVNLLLEIKKRNIFQEVDWYCHDITFSALRKNNFIEMLSNNKINLKSLTTHSEFINVLLSSACVITDGGSIAEECSILNIKTVIWRDVVENVEYLNESILLAKYDINQALDFMKVKSNKVIVDENITSPSKEFVKQLLNLSSLK